MIKILTIISLIIISGCTPRTTEVSEDFRVPKGLQDCSIYKMSNSNGTRLCVVRCPNSQTSIMTSGKHPTYASVVEG